MVRTQGYVIKDSGDLSLADFNDAVVAHENASDCCESTFHDRHDFDCTRSINHTGPHIAASGPDAIAVIWEDEL